MRNQYAGACYRCGNRVEARAGHFEKFSKNHRSKYPKAPLNIKWITQHADCAIRYRNTSVSIWEKNNDAQTQD